VTISACLAGCLVPGAGHLILRRSGRGLLLLAAIGSMFAAGVVMDARLEFYWAWDDPLASIVSLAQVGVGLPYLAARWMGYLAGDVRSATFDYGNTFTAAAGLLNLLVVLDAYDVGSGFKS
jgi:hypothetical protein